ncbi:cysteine dioxygenase family protein [Priestia filamentosa]|uniref:cysteine dioxygenase family protein n=1 Tax=Priestia filamentosa TaxID=1402861 RepID=UPI001FB3D476|nr:cysteine dioxygenase family protein [Priestia filamentosa]UOE58967.1 cysteine dioxygenase family protein [Priestia filamentosa]
MMSTPARHPELYSFIQDVDQIVQEGGGEENLISKVAERMQQLLNLGNILPDQYLQPQSKSALYPLHIAQDESFSIAITVFNVGQPSPTHDHGTWGVIGVVQGVEHEIKYARPSRENEPLTILKDRYIREGEVGICCSSEQDLHRVECASSIPCVGIHVYGRNIGKIERHIYDSNTGKKRAGVTPWVPVPAPPQ